tara:strand:+ start:1126 stop:2223 length:1098 start_codon:yes stop_codon:yes gene_type:complete
MNCKLDKYNQTNKILNRDTKFIENDTFNILNVKKKKSKISDANFVIPQIFEYEFILNYNYTVYQLKKICSRYKIKKGVKKNELILRIYNYLKYSNYAIIIQKTFRNYLQKKYNQLKGPSHIKRSLCINDSDFCTLEHINEIPYIQFFSFIGNNNQIYGCDICSLYNYIHKHKNNKDNKLRKLPLNPYNRLNLPVSLENDISNFIKLSKLLKIKIQLNIEPEVENINLSLFEKNKRAIYKIFQRIDELGNYTSADWFLELNKNKLLIFIKELHDIWCYRAQLDNQTKINICPPNGRPFFNINISSLQLHHIETIISVILIILEKFVNSGINRDCNVMGAYYILTALTLVSPSAANSMPWLYQSVAN